MRRASPILLLAAALLPAGCGSAGEGSGAGSGAGSRAAEQRAERPPERLVRQLRGGGHVLAFRHAATDSSMDTTDDLRDCSRQRNLSVEGRRQAQSIGRAIERLRIPVGRVLASPFCRTRDTARLAFGRAAVSRALLSDEFFPTPRAARRRGLRRLLGVPPRPGTNTVLVSHGTAIESATGVATEEGDAVVVAPRGEGGEPRVVATVAADAW